MLNLRYGTRSYMLPVSEKWCKIHPDLNIIALLNDQEVPQKSKDLWVTGFTILVFPNRHCSVYENRFRQLVGQHL